MDIFSFLRYQAVNDFWGEPAAMGAGWMGVEANEGGAGMAFV